MISLRAKNLKPSPTLALAAKAKELIAQGHDVISLSVGEPDWDTLECAKQAGRKAIDDGFSKYTPSNGIPELRKAIAAQTNADLKTDYTPDEVTVTAGGKFVIFAALQCAIDPGDEVIIPAPYWVSYPVMVELAGGTPVTAVCDETVNFKLTPEILQKHITPKTKMLILNSPSNPTGLMYSKEELAALAQVLRDHPRILILSDDIYNRLVFGGELAPHILQVAPELKPRVLVMNGASKTYAMTGWRVGWALGPQVWIKAMTNYQSQSVSQAASMSQKATLAAIEHGAPELKKAMTELSARKDRAVSLLSQVSGIQVANPDGAFYIWPDIRKLLGKSYKGKKLATSSDFSVALLEAQNVAVVPGVEFGLDGFVRLSFALKEPRMVEAMERIKKFVADLD
ncbi:MAG: pyridoxal phosphate-dependent aminotransferase [Bdellovibrionales bacterium]|nr:pyridoxal phosphate-dependent aminotransferase [Bdellovibrionales bacterium]